MAIARKFKEEVHFRHVPDLLEQAAGLPVRETSADRFHLDVDAWFGEACKPTITNVVHHMKRIQNADTGEPILLSAEGHVFDGLHRLARCRLEEISTIRYRQFETNPKPFKVQRFEEFRIQKPLIAEALTWMENNRL